MSRRIKFWLFMKKSTETLSFCVAILLLTALSSPAQDADTIVLKNDNQKFTILSQIENRDEAAAFLAIVNAADQSARYQRATSFVSKYPQSWLLAQAYDAVARSAIDLDKYDQALSAGRFSLRLLPENPSLLVLLANLEAQRELLAPAMADATAALDYLDQIERPPNMNQREWNVLKPQLKASAYFAKARAEVSKSSLSLADLNKAAAWNPEDPEIFYLRALVELSLKNKQDAAQDLAFVRKHSPLLREKAERVLSLLGMLAFADRLSNPAIDVSLRHEIEKAGYPQALSQGYAGADACKPCHTIEYAAWRKTGMARMLQPYKRENLIGDFSPAARFSSDEIRMGFDKRPFFEIARQRFYVDFTIGSKWQQGYVTKLPDGRMQVIPIEYNLPAKQWINYWEMIDPLGSPRAVIADFPKLTSATNYQQNCAICHTSQLKSSESLQKAVFLQPGIDCEMCHGPSAWHAKQAAKGNTAHADPLEPPFDFRKAGNRQSVRVCAQCHRQSAVREFGENGEMNYSTKDDFVPVTWLRPYDAFSRKAFFKDGRFRESTFIVEAFTRSACYLKGAAQCGTCHSPHLTNFETNQKSLKYWNNPNEMCLSCHSQFRDRIVEHSRHAAGSEASQCVACHMPRIVNALLFKVRSHQIEIPTADLTERFGQADSPNVCLSCHAEKGVAWAKEELAAWPQ